MTTDGVTTRYEYDAAGRLVREGDKRYTYGYLDKVTSVKEGANVYTYDYHVDGQLAKANYGKDGSEDFTWDGLALIQRGDEHFINEPHVGGGNPVASSKGTTYFNDMLGTTVGSKSGAKYSAAALTAFGEDLTINSRPRPITSTSFYTGKPQVAGLGHAFLMRNYRASLGKWQTADPMGYPDGWNALAYCNNGVTSAVDLWGCVKAPTSKNNMFQEDIANIGQYKAKLAKAMEEVNSQGWTIDKPHYIDNLLYYCNSDTVQVNETVPLSDVERELTGFSACKLEGWIEYADVYQRYVCTASMLKSKALDLTETAILELLSIGVGVASTVGGGATTVTVAAFRDMIRDLDGNTVTITLGDGYTCLGERMEIDQHIDVSFIE